MTAVRRLITIFMLSLAATSLFAQEPTQAQLNAIADMMAWALDEFDLPVGKIGGHYNYADTGCPGKNLRKYLEDGTFRRMVVERLGSR